MKKEEVILDLLRAVIPTVQRNLRTPIHGVVHK